MPEFFEKLFALDFMPHGHCYFWQTDVLVLNVGSDALITLSYYSIPLALFVFVRKRPDIEFKHIFVLFAAFIFACGSTHMLEAITVWKPAYRFEGLVKLVTALVSAATAIVLWRLIPQALAIPSPSQLAQANEALRIQVRERERAEQDLRRLNAELEERVAARTEELRQTNADLEQFAYVASHDLQEPLRTVSNYVQLLERRYRGELDDKADKYVGYAVGGVERMRELIRDLLTYSRAGRDDQDLRPIDPRDALEMALQDLGATIDAAGAEVTHDSLPRVRADANQLARVFQNLISNALKYAGDGPPRVHIWAEDAGTEGVVFHVRDEGIGLEPQYAEQIFEPFRRLHTREEHPGSGLGLSICQRLIQRMGGRIWVDSEPGRGATFHFTLPGAE